MNPLSRAAEVGTTTCGDKLYLLDDALVVELCGAKRVASSSLVNGGTQEGMKYLYNYSYSHSPLVQNKVVTEIEEQNLEEHYKQLTKKLGLPLETTVAMGTAAKLEERAEVILSFGGVQVSAIVTAGIDHNGGRAGDPPSYDEFTGENLMPVPGTINIMLFIGASLPRGVLNQAIITATEAKSATLQELQAGSHYSTGLATGSGTDTIMVVSDLNAQCRLYDAGLHSRLGSTIGRVVKVAVAKALSYHGEGMTKERQATLLWQGRRYGISATSVQRKYRLLYGEPPSPTELEHLMTSGELMAYVAPLLHLRDQLAWGLIKPADYKVVREQLLGLFRHYSPLTEALATVIQQL